MPVATSKPSAAAPMALAYITIGALMTVWSAIWYYYLHDHESANGTAGYFCAGFLVTGLVLLGIGFALGPIARWSRHAELPPAEAMSPSLAPNAQETAARRV
jgi:hypothetical protein